MHHLGMGAGGGVILSAGASGSGGGLGDVRLKLPWKVQTRRGKQTNLLFHVLSEMASTAALPRAMIGV